MYIREVVYLLYGPVAGIAAIFSHVWVLLLTAVSLWMISRESSSAITLRLWYARSPAT